MTAATAKAATALTARFLAKHVGETERNARRLMRLAKYAPPRQEARFGTTKLDAILDYFEAKAGQPSAGRLPIAFDEVRLDVVVGGARKRLSLDELRLDDIRVETRKLRRASGKPAAKASPVAKAVTSVLRGAKLGGVGVRVAGGKFSLSGIPVEAWADLLVALAKVSLPTE